MSIIHKFNYNTSDLTDYVNQESQNLLVRSVFEGKTAQKFSKMTGVKHSEALQLMATEVFYQASTTCAGTPSGTTTLSQRVLTVGKAQLYQSFCPRDLENFWTQKALPAGSTYDSITFESDWTSHVVDLMKEANETALWQGNTSSGTGNNQFWNGFIKILDDASALTIDGNTGNVSGAITASNVIGIFDAMWAALPAKLKGKSDLEFMCGSDVFDLYILALKNANLFHYDGVASGPYQMGEITQPGTGYKVSRYFGLDGTNRIFLGRTSNFYVGTDMESDEDYFKVKEYEDETIRARAHFKLGTQVAYPNEVVQFTLA